MQITLTNLKRWSPFVCLVLVVLIILIRMVVHGTDSPYHTDSIDAVLIYKEACSGCHGLKGKGMHFHIPDLADESVTVEEVQMKINKGGLFMPVFNKLSDIQISNLSEYVADKKYK